MKDQSVTRIGAIRRPSALTSNNGSSSTVTRSSTFNGQTLSSEYSSAMNDWSSAYTGAYVKVIACDGTDYMLSVGDTKQRLSNIFNQMCLILGITRSDFFGLAVRHDPSQYAHLSSNLNSTSTSVQTPESRSSSEMSHEREGHLQEERVMISPPPVGLIPEEEEFQFIDLNVKLEKIIPPTQLKAFTKARSKVVGSTASARKRRSFKFFGIKSSSVELPQLTPSSILDPASTDLGTSIQPGFQNPQPLCVLHLRVLQYSDDSANLMRDDPIALNLYFEQLRQNVINYGQICTEDHAYSLAALARMADTCNPKGHPTHSSTTFNSPPSTSSASSSNTPSETNGNLNLPLKSPDLLSKYFPEWLIRLHGPAYLTANLPRVQGCLRPMSKQEAILLYVAFSSQKPLPHNIHLIGARLKRSDPAHSFYLGVGLNGILVFRNENNPGLISPSSEDAEHDSPAESASIHSSPSSPTQGHQFKQLMCEMQWKDIVKLYCSKADFEITPRAVTPMHLLKHNKHHSHKNMNLSSPTKLVFHMDSITRCKYFLWLCRSTHVFHMNFAQKLKAAVAMESNTLGLPSRKMPMFPNKLTAYNGNGAANRNSAFVGDVNGTLSSSTNNGGLTNSQFLLKTSVHQETTSKVVVNNGSATLPFGLKQTNGSNGGALHLVGAGTLMTDLFSPTNSEDGDSQKRHSNTDSRQTDSGNEMSKSMPTNGHHLHTDGADDSNISSSPRSPSFSPHEVGSSTTNSAEKRYPSRVTEEDDSELLSTFRPRIVAQPKIALSPVNGKPSQRVRRSVSDVNAFSPLSTSNLSQETISRRSVSTSKIDQPLSFEKENVVNPHLEISNLSDSLHKYRNINEHLNEEGCNTKEANKSFRFDDSDKDSCDDDDDDDDIVSGGSVSFDEITDFTPEISKSSSKSTPPKPSLLPKPIISRFLAKPPTEHNSSNTVQKVVLDESFLGDLSLQKDSDVEGETF